MDDLLADFIAEAQEMLDALAGEIVAWEKDPGDRARLDNIFRFFHTVKGNCGFFDFPDLEALSHAAEDVLADVRAGRRQPDSTLVDAVLAVIDRITAMVVAIDQGETLSPEPDAILIAALQNTGATEVVVPEEAEEEEVQETRDPATTTTTRKRSVRLPVELLDRIMSGVSDMVLARNDLARRIQQEDGPSGLDAPFNRLGSILDDVRDAIARTRMQPIDSLFSGFPRMVRDLSAELGKQVMVEMENGDVELDRELIEVIRDPLVHVIRNAVDHGIEEPADRIKAGKREIGLLTISARQTGNEIRIGVIDDGRGIDPAKLLEKAVAAGIVTAEEGEKLNARERNMLICEAGFSTRVEATSVSGRGVGMDVVRSNLEQIGGSLSIDSTPGSGTRILLNVPLTLSIVPSLTVGIGAQKFAIARSYIEEVVRICADESDFSEVGSAQLITVRNKQVPCVGLGKVLGIDNGSNERMLVVIRLVGGDLIGLAVDDVFEHEELVIKPLAPVVMESGFFVGNTLMDDGSPVLMLDVSGIARAAGLIREVEHRGPQKIESAEHGQAQRRKVPVLLLDGLDGVRRAVGMQSVVRVERVLRSAVRMAGPYSQIVLESELMPLAGVPDGVDLSETVNILRLSDGREQVGYAFAEIVDISAIEEQVRTTGTGTDAAGIALIEGSPVEVLDCHKLFSRLGSGHANMDRPVCRLAGEDRWSNEFLRPLLEAAGYSIAEEEGSEVDLAVVVSDGPEIPELTAENRIWLRSQPDPAEGQEESIYRYDRARLMEALETARLECRA